ncbi:hypothetical protein [Neorhizobium tomejilense]|uniref:hypothetical protein n=1 Tax=Neorhizobium tomejilense TaxID=2093828 RepID=UPI001FDFC7DA|nr:hypothetical protein [Neorhizobium tomejilense]
MTQRYFVDGTRYLGSYDGPDETLPAAFSGATEIPSPPSSGYGDQPWDNVNDVWFDRPEFPPASVTARQFKLQLVAAGLIDSVDAWIFTQDRATQVAYEYSGSFVRNEPMMQAGFAAMGFSPEQIDDFFLAASKL